MQMQGVSASRHEKEREEMSDITCDKCGAYTDVESCTCKENAEIESLKQKLAHEHENFLTIHRENMELAARIVDLKDNLDSKCNELMRYRDVLEYLVDQDWRRNRGAGVESVIRRANNALNQSALQSLRGGK